MLLLIFKFLFLRLSRLKGTPFLLLIANDYLDLMFMILIRQVNTLLRQTPTLMMFVVFITIDIYSINFSFAHNYSNLIDIE